MINPNGDEEFQEAEPDQTAENIAQPPESFEGGATGVSGGAGFSAPGTGALTQSTADQSDPNAIPGPGDVVTSDLGTVVGAMLGGAAEAATDIAGHVIETVPTIPLTDIAGNVIEEGGVLTPPVPLTVPTPIEHLLHQIDPEGHPNPDDGA